VPTLPKAVTHRDGDERPRVLTGPRRRGLLLIAGGAAVGVALFVALIVLSRLGVIGPTTTERVVNGLTIRVHSYSTIWGVPIVVPLFSTLVGLIQVITGLPMKEFGGAYASMSGGRRLVVSVLVVALALGVIGTLVAIVFSIML
jgi:hypothetical protein